MNVEELRLAVYRSFATGGRAPRVSELAADFHVRRAEVESGLRQLARERHLVLADGGDEEAPDSVAIVMAHPFSSIPLGFVVMGRRTLWWGGCAWDSFALPHLLPDQDELLVATTCPACGYGHAWVVTDQAPPPGAQVAHFLVPAARMWEDVVYTCGHQRIFCSRDCVNAWLARKGLELGYVMDLPTLWRLAAHWYDGRLDHGYTRRDPVESSEYLQDVGLTGRFWGR